MTESVLAKWLAHLEVQHPKTIDLGLERTREVADRLGLLAPHCKTITVAGTNGKGTCVAALDALLRAQPGAVGLYTSPHLLRYNERIVINGEPAGDDDIVAAFRAIEVARSDISLSYFEFSTLAALWLFRRAGVAWQILEVGLGGRLDAVNIIDADGCVITSIGLDHIEWLGDTRELIAIEKAGVARNGRPVIIAESEQPETLRPTLEAIGADVFCINSEWRLTNNILTMPDGRVVTLPVPMGLQPQNLGAAVVALHSLGVDEPHKTTRQSLNSVRLAGRQQRFCWRARDVWCDVAHNLESVSALVVALEAAPSKTPCHAVFAGMSDKPLHAMITAIGPLVDHWHLPPLTGISRAASPSSVEALLEKSNSRCYESIDGLAQYLLEITEVDDRIVVFGSFVTVGALLAQFNEHSLGANPQLSAGAEVNESYK